MAMGSSSGFALTTAVVDAATVAARNSLRFIGFAPLRRHVSITSDEGDNKRRQHQMREEMYRYWRQLVQYPPQRGRAATSCRPVWQTGRAVAVGSGLNKHCPCCSFV